MSEIMNGDEINEIERYIPSGNPDALHRPLRNVVASHRALQAKVRELEERLGEVEAGRECVHIDEYQALQDRVHELEDKLRQVEQERDQLRARVGELEEAVQGFLTRMNKWGEWDDGCFYYAKKSAPELQEPIRQARRALEGKEEHGI